MPEEGRYADGISVHPERKYVPESRPTDLHGCFRIKLGHGEKQRPPSRELERAIRRGDEHKLSRSSPTVCNGLIHALSRAQVLEWILRIHAEN